ncbi:NAD(P)H-dependent oxidoreductase [Mycobacterium sp. NPDC050551]|uniref:FMN-dependent NADH-azoreductase n=1 Tax=Mycobacterium sp. NPDC050551 TaxID=3155407 RepID=UPI00341435CE
MLLVNASPRGEDSHSLRLANRFLDAYCMNQADVAVDRLDTFSDLAPFGQGQVDAKMAVITRRPVPEEAAGDWAKVLDVAARVQLADTLVFAVPMWNGGIPWSLKLFIDTVTQPGIAFTFDPAIGYRGLLGGRRAVTIYTSRVYAPGVSPAFGVDHQSAYLRWWLEYCGITDIHELRLQTLTPDEDSAVDAVVRLAEALAPRVIR